MDQTGPGPGLRMWNQFAGQGKCLDIVNDDSGRLQLAATRPLKNPGDCLIISARCGKFPL
jgi:hypothetical protein